MKFILLLFALSTLTFADVQPASLFQDHMVLQMNKPIVVWGTGDAGEQVEVTFKNQKQSTQVNQKGKWSLTLPAMEGTAKGSNFIIQGKNKVTLKDVVVGDVWICSGQSNMAMGHASIPELKELASQDHQGLLRTFMVPTKVSFTPKDSVNGRWSLTPASSAVAFSFSYHLQKQINVPIGILQTAWGSSSIEGWMPIELTESLPHFKNIMAKFEKEDREKVSHLIKKKKWEKKENIYLRTRPNILYNAMLHPLIPFSVRGMVWYQGEANSSQPENYQKSLHTWVPKLRSLWKTEDFYFLPVMLPGFGRGVSEQEYNLPNKNTWAWFRDAQLSVLDIPKTLVPNTIDLGDPKNIHPKDKKPIGIRLAKLVAKNIYQQNLLPQGPSYKSHSIEGSKVSIEFRYSDGLKTLDQKPPKGFWIAGSDKVWKEASALIKDEKIELTHPEVSKPVAIRYAFAAMPDVNLVNQDNLPTYPFRTDSWGRPKR